MKIRSSNSLERFFLPSYEASCKILQATATTEMIGCITLDGWSAALRATILGMNWHFTDENWRLKCIPSDTLDMEPALKMAISSVTLSSKCRTTT